MVRRHCTSGAQHPMSRSKARLVVLIAPGRRQPLGTSGLAPKSSSRDRIRYMATPLRLLLIEDSENDALLLELELRRGGYDVRLQRVQTAAANRTALATPHWGPVLSDVAMP